MWTTVNSESHNFSQVHKIVTILCALKDISFIRNVEYVLNNFHFCMGLGSCLKAFPFDINKLTIRWILDMADFIVKVPEPSLCLFINGQPSDSGHLTVNLKESSKVLLNFESMWLIWHTQNTQWIGLGVWQLFQWLRVSYSGLS